MSTKLDQFRKQAEAGVPDHALAVEAGVSVSTIRRWRRKLGITRTSGWERRKELIRNKARAMNLGGLENRDVLQRCQSSALGGKWRVPEYLVREPVDYDRLVLQIGVLRSHGFSTADIARAHGYTTRTVEQALILYESK